MKAELGSRRLLKSGLGRVVRSGWLRSRMGGMHSLVVLMTAHTEQKCEGGVPIASYFWTPEQRGDEATVIFPLFALKRPPPLLS
jgi:hypothetical protein